MPDRLTILLWNSIPLRYHTDRDNNSSSPNTNLPFLRASCFRIHPQLPSTLLFVAREPSLSNRRLLPSDTDLHRNTIVFSIVPMPLRLRLRCGDSTNTYR